MTLPTPLEEVEQATFVRWLEIKGYKFTAIPNSTYTKSWKQKARNKLMGLRAGFPDMVVIAEGKFMAVEMKRIKDGRITPAQSSWIESLKSANVPVAVCYGAEQAITFVKGIVSE